MVFFLFFAKQPTCVADAVAGNSGTVPKVLCAVVCLAIATLGESQRLMGSIF